MGYYYDSPPQYPAEQTYQATNPITLTANDVLMGRGGKNNLHCGNEKLRKLARSKANDYQRADKKEKSSMSIELVTQVHALSPAGRFLRRDPICMVWHVVPDELAREKCSQCLRDAVSSLKTSLKKQQQSKPRKQTKPQQKRTLQTTEEAPKSVRRVSHGLVDMDAVSVTSSNKRRRTEGIDDDTRRTEGIDDDTSTSKNFTVPAVITGELFDNSTQPIQSKIFECVARGYDPEFEFDLFDCTELVCDEGLLWEKFQELSGCTAK